MSYIFYKTSPTGINKSIIFQNKPTIDDINNHCYVKLSEEQYAELIKKGCIDYNTWEYIYLSEIEEIINN